MLLENRNAVVYGASGSIGSAVAAAFAREGARVFLVGRTREDLAKVAAEITDTGGRAEVAVLDALDEQAVDAHVRSVVDTYGSVDISLNLVRRGDVQGVPLVDMATADLVDPVVTGVTTNFVTARAAARHMVAKGSGVILVLNSGSANGSPMMGGTGPADAATDTLVRNLAAEIGPAGVRVLGVWVAGIPETLTPTALSRVNSNLAVDEVGIQALIGQLDSMRITRRSPRLAEVVDTLVFLASAGAAGITGTFVNATSMPLGT